MSTSSATDEGGAGRALTVEYALIENLHPLAGWIAVGASAAAALPAAQRRLLLSRAKHPSLGGHVRWARRLSRQIPAVDYDEQRFFDSDGAGAEVAARRRAALERLSALYAQRYAKTLARTAELEPSLSDLQFTSRYRVPFQYAPLLRRFLKTGAFLQSSQGVRLTDLDGNVLHDLGGSYGVNVFGYEFYKACIREGVALADPLGPVLGAYHPVVLDNVRRLKALSGHDEVSFHMSGTEAVMQAVRLARYHTGRTHLVRLCGAYHGWWEDVQPGPGNPSMPRETYTLRDMDERTLEVLRTRRDIACVLVNPIQGLHPNRAAPADSALVDSSRSAGFDRAAYAAWLQQLRRTCTERGIVLILDDVFLGFRIGRGGSQEYFGIKADLVTYGKTIAGGLPVGVVCGRAELMRRFREDRPADVNFARGTFNAHPYVMGAMDAFLRRIDTPQVLAVYEGLDERWNARASRFNARLAAAGAPLRVANLSSVFTVGYTQPSRYNWMLQYYLRAEGLALGWVGTGRLIFSLDHDDAAFDAVVDRFVAAAGRMFADGWWPGGPELTDRGIRRRVLRELLRRRILGSAHAVR